MQVKVDEIVPGMTLAEPITNAGGVTLMPAGIRLTPMFIARIRKWNIETLDVFPEKPRSPDTAVRLRSSTSVRLRAAAAARPPPPPPQSEEAVEFARATALEISRPFVGVKSNALMMALRAAVIKKLVRHGKNGVVNILRRTPAAAPPVENPNETASHIIPEGLSDGA